MSTCPSCNSDSTYQDRNLWVCAECFHEWDPAATAAATASAATAASAASTPGARQFLDANGVQLQDGDTVITTKDLKLGKETLKSGTKVKSIRLLTEPVDGHDISCKIPEHGSLYLKCSVVKKAK